MNARDLMKARTLLDMKGNVYFEIVRSHQIRRSGWRGLIDLILCRAPIRVIDEARIVSASLAPEQDAPS